MLCQVICNGEPLGGQADLKCTLNATPSGDENRMQNGRKAPGGLNFQSRGAFQDDTRPGRSPDSVPLGLLALVFKSF